LPVLYVFSPSLPSSHIPQTNIVYGIIKHQASNFALNWGKLICKCTICWKQLFWELAA
jgi:hypothetical protein